MGREWLYWVGGGGARRRRSMSADIKQQGTGGCMCAVFQLFDLHQFQLPLNHQHSFQLHLQQETETEPEPEPEPEPDSFKGVEAPRNSLELEETEALKAPSKPSAMNKQNEENLNFPVGINQIKTRASISCTISRAEDLGSDSPGTKTPNLVARLMGLDLLPECSSPSSNPNRPTKPHLHQKRSNRCFSDDDISVGARSLPETPRTSSSRRSDVDHHHRLSLQINKERTNDEFVGKRGRFRKQDENCNSPGHYARQIVKQVKESVSRRVGLLDITNTNRDHKDEQRRDQNLLIKLHRKSPNLSPKLDGEINPNIKQSTAQSCSPKLKFLDSKKCKSVTDTAIKSPRNSSSSESCSNPSKPKHQVIIHEQQNDCRKIEIGMKKLRGQSLDKGKEEAFVRSAAKKSKKSPLSSELMHISAPTLLPVKKDPSPPATKLPQKQVSPDSLSSKRNTQLSCNTRHSYTHLHKISTEPNNTNGCTTTVAAPEYKVYVNKILKRAGIADKFTPLTLGKWHTPSHPLDPSIFYYLELFHPATAAVLSRRSNRKLIFQLVDELLVDILRPRLDFKRSVFSNFRIDNNCFGLVDELCKRIEGFPGAKCRVLEDIDCLVDNDLCRSPLSGCYREEEERIVCEIEGEIVEWLVCETVALVGVRTDI